MRPTSDVRGEFLIHQVIRRAPVQTIIAFAAYAFTCAAMARGITIDKATVIGMVVAASLKESLGPTSEQKGLSMAISPDQMVEIGPFQISKQTLLDIVDGALGAASFAIANTVANKLVVEDLVDEAIKLFPALLAVQALTNHMSAAWIPSLKHLGSHFILQGFDFVKDMLVLIVKAYLANTHEYKNATTPEMLKFFAARQVDVFSKKNRGESNKYWSGFGARLVTVACAFGGACAARAIMGNTSSAGVYILQGGALTIGGAAGRAAQPWTKKLFLAGANWVRPQNAQPWTEKLFLACANWVRPSQEGRIIDLEDQPGAAVGDGPAAAHPPIENAGSGVLSTEQPPHSTAVAGTTDPVPSDDGSPPQERASTSEAPTLALRPEGERRDDLKTSRPPAAENPMRRRTKTI